MSLRGLLDSASGDVSVPYDKSLISFSIDGMDFPMSVANNVVGCVVSGFNDGKFCKLSYQYFQRDSYVNGIAIKHYMHGVNDKDLKSLFRVLAHIKVGTEFSDAVEICEYFYSLLNDGARVYYNIIEAVHDKYPDKFSIDVQGMGKKYIPDDLSRTITRIDIFDIRSADGNTRKHFDFIDVELFLVSSTKEKSRKLVDDNYKALVSIALQELNNKKRYTRYGVPTEFLKVGKAVITAQNTLLITFELKEIEAYEH